jgi:hypothetical protein
VFNEVWVPFSAADMPEGESIGAFDVDAHIPYLTEKWPKDGRPHRVALQKPGLRGNPPGVDGWVVFRLPPPVREVDPEAPVINWTAVLKERLRDRD